MHILQRFTGDAVSLHRVDAETLCTSGIQREDAAGGGHGVPFGMSRFSFSSRLFVFFLVSFFVFRLLGGLVCFLWATTCSGMGRADAGGMSWYPPRRGFYWFRESSGMPPGGLFFSFFLIMHVRSPSVGQEFQPQGDRVPTPYKQHSPSYQFYNPEVDSEGGAVPARVAVGVQVFLRIDSCMLASAL